MPNNANARREKDKKKKDKNKKTDPPPLHKEDKTITDSSSSSLSLAGKDKASVDSPSLSLASKGKASADSSSSLSLAGIHEVPDGKTLKLDALREKHSRSLSQKERLEKIAQVRKGNPGASEEEIKTLYRAHLLDEALKAQDLEVERRAAKRRQEREDERQQEPDYALA